MEFTIYPNAAVDENGLTVVSPELIVNLMKDVDGIGGEGYKEGDFGLTVKYADLKTLIEMAGHTVKEITLEKPE